MDEEDTVAIMDKEDESVAIASVGGELVGGWELLEALRRDRREVAGVLRVLREHHGPPRHEPVDGPTLFPFIRHCCAPRSSLLSSRIRSRKTEIRTSSLHESDLGRQRSGIPRFDRLQLLPGQIVAVQVAA
ncbi:hypothetical protein B296_00048726, partial [Ensete ventricosum]